MKSLGRVISRASLLTLAVVTWSASSLTARRAHAAGADRGANADYVGEVRPAPCPNLISPSGYFQGEYFRSVRMLLARATGTLGNIGNYDNLDSPVRSANGLWDWYDGGGTFTCHIQTIIPYVLWIEYQVLVPPSWGILLPVYGGGGGGGGGSGDDPERPDDSEEEESCIEFEIRDENGSLVDIINTCDEALE